MIERNQSSDQPVFRITVLLAQNESGHLVVFILEAAR
jgi:hypothetical protein